MKLPVYSFLLTLGLIFITPLRAAIPDSYYLAIKGGISLGSYETGLNRTLLKYIQQQKALGEARQLEPRRVTFLPRQARLEVVVRLAPERRLRA